MSFLTAVLPFLTTGFNAASNAVAQGGTNRASREWQEKMYGQQRKDALADWAMQNEYNSPTAQMARLRDAKLNPNLVYGNGATTTAAPTRGADAGSWRPEAPRFDVGNPMAAYTDIQLKEAQTDNLQAQNTVLLNEAALKAAQTAETTARTDKTGVDTETGRFSLSQSQRLADISAETAAEQLRKLSTETDINLDRNAREKVKQASDLATAAESILKSRSDRETAVGQRRLIDAQIESLKRDPQIKDLDLEFKKLGIGPNDPAILRILGRALTNPDIQNAAKSAYQQLRIYLEKIKMKQF